MDELVGFTIELPFSNEARNLQSLVTGKLKKLKRNTSFAISVP